MEESIISVLILISVVSTVMWTLREKQLIALEGETRKLIAENDSMRADLDRVDQIDRLNADTERQNAEARRNQAQKAKYLMKYNGLRLVN